MSTLFIVLEAYPNCKTSFRCHLSVIRIITEEVIIFLGMLNTFNPIILNVCSECGTTGTLFHCLWDDPIMQSFWKDILDILSYFISVKLIKPIWYVFNYIYFDFFSPTSKLSKADKKMFIFSLVQAKHA